MDGIHPYFCWLLLLFLQTSTVESQICIAATSVNFPENNKVGDVVTTISVQDEVELSIVSTTPSDNQFRIEGNQLIAAKVLDYEMSPDIEVVIRCLKIPTGQTNTVALLVLLENENDNPPTFDKDLYRTSVNELSPIDTSVGSFAATDPDKTPLYYRLTSASTDFKLRSTTIPDILVNAHLDYDKVKEVQLVLEAQDTALGSPPEEISFTATTTIMISVLDVDNRPPWFQPCNKLEMGGALICGSAGYTGRVDLNVQETGVLPLKPGPLYAIDGDIGINEEITYSFLSGNEDGLFEINPNTGNITMSRPTDVLGTISLTVLAAQKINSHQFATTNVLISVQVKSIHAPKFQRLQYEALVISVGSMAVDPKNNQALHILATDEDYAGTGGLNPYITYLVEGSNDFSIVSGYLFMTKELPEGTLSLQVLAKDTSNDETDTAQLSVEVKSGSSTTSLPLSTTDIMSTTLILESTTNSKTTNEFISTTNPSMSTGISTTSSSITSENTIATSNPTSSNDGGSSTPVTVHPVAPSGAFGVVDMAALGATLGVLLFASLVVIGVLVHRMQRGKTDWKKIQEAAMFRNFLGQGSEPKKEGMQYTNEAFQRDDGSSIGSGGPEGRIMAARGNQPNAASNIPELTQRSSAPLHTLLPDNTSDTGLDRADDEKEVKPILTKERRVEEGYKSVWFKEDIDPNAKEEVVIIPDNRKEESDEEEDSEPSFSGKEVHENKNFQRKAPKVVFADTDLDSGLGVKIDDPADSESDQDMNIDL